MALSPAEPRTVTAPTLQRARGRPLPSAPSPPRGAQAPFPEPPSPASPPVTTHSSLSPGPTHLGEQDAQQEARHDGVVVHEPDEHGVGAAPHIDDVLHAEALYRESPVSCRHLLPTWPLAQGPGYPLTAQASVSLVPWEMGGLDHPRWAALGTQMCPHLGEHRLRVLPATCFWDGCQALVQAKNLL